MALHAADFQAAISVGAQHVMTLPEQDREVVAELSDAVESAREGDGRGYRVWSVGGNAQDEDGAGGPHAREGQPDDIAVVRVSGN